MTTTTSSHGAKTLAFNEPCEALDGFLKGLTPSQHSELAPLIPHGGKDDGYKLGLAMDWIEDHGGDREWAGHLTTDYVSDRSSRVLRKKVIAGWWDYVCQSVGDTICIDTWLRRTLVEGDDFSTFRLNTAPGLKVESPESAESLAIEVGISGRKAYKFYGRRVVRVKVVFPEDGEPDTVTRGWLVL